MLVEVRSDSRVQKVDTEIFQLRYFSACMQCNFCQDSCCQYGCDVNLFERERILAVADSLEPVVGHPRSQWFTTEVKHDPEYPSGQFVRASVVNGACVFLNRNGRGCLLHKWSLENGRDYHEVKPMVCWLFPVTWDQGVLRASWDVKDDLVCVDKGPTLYEAAREEIGHVFGAAFVAELDAIRASLGELPPVPAQPHRQGVQVDRSS